ncbi:MAG: ABC transporter permease [Puniceicoccaceae bacterium]
MASSTQPNRKEGKATPITPSHPVLSLLWQLCIREITEATKGSALGLLWIVLGPLLSMGLYVVVFGVLFEGSFDKGPMETSIHYALGVYIGLTSVNVMNDTLGRSPVLIPSKVNFVKRVIFPLPLLPIVQVAGSSFKWLVNIGLWLLFSFLLQSLTVNSLLWLPLILLPMLLYALGIAWLVSSVSVYFRDVAHLVPVLTQIIFWSSGVFYSTQRVMEYPAIWNILRWNPFLLSIENTRQVVLWNEPANMDQLAFLWISGLAVSVLGYIVFHRLKNGFSEML